MSERRDELIRRVGERGRDERRPDAVVIRRIDEAPSPRAAHAPAPADRRARRLLIGLLAVVAPALALLVIRPSEPGGAEADQGAISDDALRRGLVVLRARDRVLLGLLVSDDGFVVTAADAGGGVPLARQGPFTAQIASAVATRVLCESSAERDESVRRIGLLRIEGVAGEAPPLSTADVPPAQAVWLFTHAGDDESPVLRTRSLIDASPKTAPGALYPFRFLGVRSAAEPSSVGSPIFDANGRVVGLATAAEHDDAQNVVSARAIRARLREARTEPLVPCGP